MMDRNSKNFYQNNWPLMVKLLKVDKTNCIHHGFYQKGIHTHFQAVLNMNDFVGHLLGLDLKDKQTKQILDAGCGIGGTVIYLAKKYPHINFTGITVVSEHIEIAKNLAKENKVSTNTGFILKDFINTGFPFNSFDAIFLIESSCYALKKDILIHEMNRILKPKGILVIIDVFLTNVKLNPFLNNFYIWFCKGWGLPNLIKLEDFIYILKTENFHEMVIKDLTKNVKQTIIRGDILSLPYLFSTISNKIILGKRYRIENDSKFLGIIPILLTILGIKKGITYNAVIAIK